MVLDTIVAKSRHKLNDTFSSFTQQYLPKYDLLYVEVIENLPIAIVIKQRKPASNSHSTVITYTDIYALLWLQDISIFAIFAPHDQTLRDPLSKIKKRSGIVDK